MSVFLQACFDACCHGIGSANGDSGFVNHDFASVYVLGNTIRNTHNVTQVGAAVVARGGANADKQKVAVLDGCSCIAGEGQQSLFHCLQHHIAEARLEKGDLASPQALDARLVDVHADNTMAYIGKDGCLYQTNVATTENTYTH